MNPRFVHPVREFLIIILLATFVLNGCSLLALFKKGETAKATPEGLYSRASTEFRNGNYKKAQEYF